MKMIGPAFLPLHSVRVIIIFPRNRAIKPKGRGKKPPFASLRRRFFVACALRARKSRKSAERRRKNHRRSMMGSKRGQKSRGQSADHVGAVTVTPRVATCQITHLARVNNYSETHIIALHYRITYLTRASPRDAPFGVVL